MSLNFEPESNSTRTPLIEDKLHGHALYYYYNSSISINVSSLKPSTQKKKQKACVESTRESIGEPTQEYSFFLSFVLELSDTRGINHRPDEIQDMPLLEKCSFIPMQDNSIIQSIGSETFLMVIHIFHFITNAFLMSV
jgi:hypothetical protein